MAAHLDERWWTKDRMYCMCLEKLIKNQQQCREKKKKMEEQQPNARKFR